MNTDVNSVHSFKQKKRRKKRKKKMLLAAKDIVNLEHSSLLLPLSQVGRKLDYVASSLSFGEFPLKRGRGIVRAHQDCSCQTDFEDS